MVSLERIAPSIWSIRIQLCAANGPTRGLGIITYKDATCKSQPGKMGRSRNKSDDEKEDFMENIDDKRNQPGIPCLHPRHKGTKQNQKTEDGIKESQSKLCYWRQENQVEEKTNPVCCDFGRDLSPSLWHVSSSLLVADRPCSTASCCMSM